jgi:hypothetical protein
VKAERRKQVKPFAYFQLGASLFFIENKKMVKKASHASVYLYNSFVFLFAPQRRSPI